LEALLDRYAKSEGYFESGLERWGVFVLLDSDDGLAGDADSVSQVLLCHIAKGTEFADLIANGGH